MNRGNRESNFRVLLRSKIGPPKDSVVDYLDEVYLNTWNEVLDTVSQLVNQKITSKEQFEDILEEINTPDSEHIVVTEVQIV